MRSSASGKDLLHELGLNRAASPAGTVFYPGTYRLVSPAETVARVSELMPVMGITRIANVTGLDRIGVPVVMVCRPNARSLAVSQGKGLDLDSARASGLMESVETYHAEHITLPLKLCSYEELRYTSTVVDVADLPRPAGGLFDPHRPLLWIEGYDLLQAEAVWVPYEAVHSNYTLSQLPGMGSFISSTNGLASGNHLLEAISHGLCEVVERDAGCLWALRPDAVRQSTRVSLDSVDDPACCSVLARLREAGVAADVWEITSDIALPAFRCTIREVREDRLHPIYPASGSGCHPARHVALLRALTEAIQSRLTAIAGSRDDLFRSRYEEFYDPDLFGERHEAAGDDPRRRYPGASWQGETLDELVGWELEQLERAGVLRVIVIDLTKDEMRLPVARVVVPGLEFSHGGRPVSLGRRARRAMER